VQKETLSVDALKKEFLEKIGKKFLKIGINFLRKLI